VLVLDEGTANLDEQTEGMIARGIAGLPMTRIAISHRPALVTCSDIVFHVEGGKIERRERSALRAAS
jgi:ATP-binding cassette subfamily B protein RaxB